MLLTPLVNGRVVVFCALFAACGCAGSQHPTATAAAPPAATSCGCPMMIPGVTTSVADTQGGVAITFQAPADRVDEVRASVRRMAAMQGMRMPPAEARAEDVPGGARLVLTAKDPSTIDALRAHVRAHTERMSDGGCPMM